MGGLSLLAEARAAGLAVTAEGGRLVIRGPRSAEEVARRLMGAKEEVLALLAPPPAPEERFRPLDAAVAADEAAKRDRARIAARLVRLEARAGRPGATALDRQIAADWRAILAAKDGADWDR